MRGKNITEEGGFGGFDSMGKVRKHKQKPARVDPVGLDSAIAELQHGMDQV